MTREEKHAALVEMLGNIVRWTGPEALELEGAANSIELLLRPEGQVVYEALSRAGVESLGVAPLRPWAELSSDYQAIWNAAAQAA